MISDVLFQPRVNSFLARLDDSKSMFSIAIRDGVDSSGRTLMEMKRNNHGGRERLIEEFLTMIIWGFGINWMKQLYDGVVRNSTRVKHPDLDMDLLLDKPQALTSEWVREFNAKYPGAYDKLEEVLTSSVLKKSYHLSNVAKFVIATGLPALLIAFGIPTFNQWLTRKKQAEEKDGLPLQPGIWPKRQVSIRQPNSFAIFGAVPVPGGLTSRWQPPAGSVSGSVPLRFGLASQMANGVSRLLQNEQANTLLVDGVISGGRTYKGGSWNERLEILFREGSIIFFLYFAQRHIQKFFSGLFDRMLGIDSSLDFKGIKFLRDVYGNDKKRFLSEYQQAVDGSLGKLLREPGTPELLEARLTEMVREYALNNGKDNMVFETAKACNWIKTFKSKDGQVLLDLTRKVQTGPMLDYLKMLEKVAAKLEAGGTGQQLGSLLKKSMTGRFGALILSNVVCAFFLSYLIPKIQHTITEIRTGKKNYFPGLDRGYRN